MSPTRVLVVEDSPTQARLLRLILEEEGFTKFERDDADGRRRPIALTKAGREEVVRIAQAVKILDHAYADLLREIGIDLFAGCARVECANMDFEFEQRLSRAASELNQGEKAPCV